jgi:hypothetical protein
MFDFKSIAHKSLRLKKFSSPFILLTAAGSGEEVVAASDYRALQSQIRELHRLLGKKSLEAERRLSNTPPAQKQLRLPPI